jgi:hypothetical protein
VVRAELQVEERSDEAAAPPEPRGARGVTSDGRGETRKQIFMPQLESSVVFLLPASARKTSSSWFLQPARVRACAPDRVS